VYHNRQLFIDTDENKWNQVVDFDIIESTKWEGYKHITADISVINNSTLTISPNSYVILDGTLTIEEGSSIIFGNGSKIVIDDGKNARIIGNFDLSDNFIFKVRDNATLSFQLSKFNIKPDTYVKVGTGSKIIVENGSELVFEDGSGVIFETNSGIEVKNKGKLITNDLTSDKVIFFCPTGKWEGITCENGSSLKIADTELHDANYAVSGTGTYQFDINNSTFIRCGNGIELIGMQPGYSYKITDNILTGIDDGRGISITSSDGEFVRNVISHFNTGATFIMSSPAVSKCEISYNKYYGIVISGSDALPQLINTEQMQAYGELNSLIKKNGYVSNTDIFPSAQIGIIPVGSVYMRNNDVISSINYPGISIAQKDIRDQHILIGAQYNYWGAEVVTDDYFFGHTDYTIDYEPYYSAPCGTGGINPTLMQSISTESRILSNALNLEAKDKLTPAIKLYEHIIKKYFDTPEYYVAMARLPYLYEKAELDNNVLIAIYDEAIESENISHKKFFKGKKVATHIKGKRYDDAILVAEEMKAEAGNEEEIILADINIGIANMLKNTDGKGRSDDQANDLRELIAKLYGKGDDNPIGNPSDITESSLPSQHTLYQNYPNPFNPTTQFKFALVKTADVKLSVYNISGQKVAELANGTRQSGVHTVDFDGSKFNSGVYYYTLEVEGKSLTQKMILMK
ncbi:MAG: T9SS type A sorting domain-containing protein, partial [Candidatus Delongbacteria bacterium]|nr:T9SS type A sorting domain-containing protein [Candidatus Delongbacteria bacterium]